MLQQRAAARAAASSAGGGGGGAVSYQAVSGSGVFMWPVSGPITSPFGYRDHPIFGRQILHAGIDIGVDEGTPVAAADSGLLSTPIGSAVTAMPSLLTMVTDYLPYTVIIHR